MQLLEFEYPWNLNTSYEKGHVVSPIQFNWDRLPRFVWSLARCSRQLAAAWGLVSRAQCHVTAVASAQRRLGLEGKPPLEDARTALSELHRSRAAAATFFATLQVKSPLGVGFNYIMYDIIGCGLHKAGITL